MTFLQHWVFPTASPAVGAMKTHVQNMRTCVQSRPCLSLPLLLLVLPMIVSLGLAFALLQVPTTTKPSAQE